MARKQKAIPTSFGAPPQGGAPRKQQRRQKRQGRSFFGRAVRAVWKTFLWTTSMGIVTGGAGGAYLYQEATKDLPDIESLGDFRPPEVTRILARDGKTELGTIYTQRRTPMDVNTLPEHVLNAFIAAEDGNFEMHKGVDPEGILRAAVTNVTQDRENPHGASTITQQVIKNTLGAEDESLREKTLIRKVKEGILAWRLETKLRKKGILGLYLNTIYLGDGAYGIEEAAKGSFGKQAKDMSIGEAALLAGMPKAPSTYSLRKNIDETEGLTPLERQARHPAFVRRNTYVLPRMVELGMITQQQADEAKATLVEVMPRPKSVTAPEFVEIVEVAKNMLKERVSKEDYELGGYTIYTTIDPALQKAARAAVQDSLVTYDKDFGLQVPFTAAAKKNSGQPGGLTLFSGTPKRGGVYVGKVTGTDDETGTISVQVGDMACELTLDAIARFNPEKLPPSRAAEVGAVLRVTMPNDWKAGEKPLLGLKDHGPQAALISTDVQTGEVRAVVGGYEGGTGTNRALASKRQPGSGFKPLHYSYALQNGFVSPATLFHNVETSHGRETFTFRRGLEVSNNDMANRVFNAAGANTSEIRKILEWVGGFGVDTSEMQPDRSLALGSYEVSPIDMNAAYGVFARAGVYKSPVIIRLIKDRTGGVTYKASPKTYQAIDPATAWLMTDIMKGVVESGTGQRVKEIFAKADDSDDGAGAAVPNTAVAGKTGTTNLDRQTRDVWFNGITPDIATTVWSGYDLYTGGQKGMGTGLSVSGGRYAIPIWNTYMREALKGRQALEFPPPPANSVLQVDVDKKTGHIYAVAEKDFEGRYEFEEVPVPEPIEELYPVDTFRAEQCEGGEASLVMFEPPEPVEDETGMEMIEEPKTMVLCRKPGEPTTYKESFLASAMYRTLLKNPEGPPPPEPKERPLYVPVPNAPVLRPASPPPAPAPAPN